MNYLHQRRCHALVNDNEYVLGKFFFFVIITIILCSYNASREFNKMEYVVQKQYLTNKLTLKNPGKSVQKCNEYENQLQNIGNVIRLLKSHHCYVCSKFFNKDNKHPLILVKAWLRTGNAPLPIAMTAKSYNPYMRHWYSMC